MKQCLSVLLLIGAFCWYKIAETTEPLDRQANAENRFIDEVRTLITTGLNTLGVHPAVSNRLTTTYDVFDPYKHNLARAALWLPRRALVQPQFVDTKALQEWLGTIGSVVCTDPNWRNAKRDRYCGYSAGATSLFEQRDLHAMYRLVSERIDAAKGHPWKHSSYECTTDAQCWEAYMESDPDGCVDHLCTRGWCWCIHFDD